MKFRDYLIKLGACNDAVEWVGDKTRAQAWEQCVRPDWMLWLIRKEKLLSDKHLRLLACDFAEEVLPIFEKERPNDDRPRKCIEVAHRYALGMATEEEQDAAWAATGNAVAAIAAAAPGTAAREKQCDMIRECVKKNKIKGE